jgi:hypothetical protein
VYVAHDPIEKECSILTEKQDGKTLSSHRRGNSMEGRFIA